MKMNWTESVEKDNSYFWYWETKLDQEVNGSPKRLKLKQSVSSTNMVQNVFSILKTTLVKGKGKRMQRINTVITSCSSCLCLMCIHSQSGSK